MYSGSHSLPAQCVTVMVRPRRRGPGPRPTTLFEYNLRREIPTNVLVQLGCDSLRGGSIALLSKANVEYFKLYFLNGAGAVPFHVGR
jgi:hypothetical protein